MYRYGDGATIATILTYLLPTLLMSLPLLMMLIIGRYFVVENLRSKQVINEFKEDVENVKSDEEILKEKIEAIENEEEPQIEEIKEELEQIEESKEENKED